MEIITILKTSLTLTVLLSAPLLIAAIISGILISLIQTLVQVQDQTLPFTVKLVSVSVVLASSGGWIASEMMGLMNVVFTMAIKQ